MRISIERSTKGKRNRIYLRSAYSAEVVRRCKQVDGRSWSDTEKAWSFPLDMSTCTTLRRLFGNALDIGPELWAWAAEERERYDISQSILNGSQGVCKRVEKHAPRLADAFASRPYQATGAAFLAAVRYGLNGDDPGLGKTLETFGAVIEAGIDAGTILVFCPSVAILSVWTREIRRWLPNDNAIPVYGDRAARIAAMSTLKNRDKTRRTWMICNTEMVRVKFEAVCVGPQVRDAQAMHAFNLQGPCNGEFVGCLWGNRHKKVVEPTFAQFFEEEWNAIIVDESHKGIVTTTSLKGKQSQQRVGFGMLKEAEGGMRIALSGTPWRGKPQNFWGTLNWLRPDIYTGYWRWAEKFFDIDDNGFGRTVGKLKPEAEDEWNRELRAVMIRRTKEEVASDLPPKLYAGTYLTEDESGLKGVWLEMEPAQKRAYEKFSRDLMLNVAGGYLMGKNLLSAMGRMRQLATAPLRQVGTRIVKGEEQPVYEPMLPSNKFNWLCESFLPERGILGDVFGDKKVIISSNYTTTVNLFRRALEAKGVMSHCITGETKPRDRERMVNEFQGNGGPRVFFLNTQAGGTALTLDAADDVVKLDREWIPDNDTQLEDRAHRVSRIHQVTVYNLYSLGTIEEEIGLIADTRDDIQKRLLDGMRGVKFVRKILNMEEE